MTEDERAQIDAYLEAKNAADRMSLRRLRRHEARLTRRSEAGALGPKDRARLTAYRRELQLQRDPTAALRNFA